MMRNFYKTGLMLLCLAGFGPAAQAELTLCKDGASEYVIVLPDAPIAAEVTAAQELNTHFKEICGATLPVKSETEAGQAAKRILIGQTAAALKLIPGLDYKMLKPDEIVIESVGDDLILSGDRSRGSLYAADTLLEDYLGCRWWTSSESTIPRRDTITIAPISLRYAPPFISREAYYTDIGKSEIFAVRLKNNGHFNNQSAALGGHVEFVGWCHTFFQMLPPKEYFQLHPEWYAQVNGKRVDDGQLCLTNPEVKAEIIKVALRWLDSHPDAKIISISQNDTAGNCSCPDCKALDDANGGPAGSLITFVNEVAEEIGKSHPDVMVETLAYVYSRQAPAEVRPAKNVLVRLAIIEGDFSKPIDSEANKTIRDDLTAWSAIAPQLFIWDYATNFHQALLPHANLKPLAQNLRFFADHKVVGVFEQGDRSTTIGHFVRLRAWLISHLLWNPRADQNALIDDFLQGYYGAAAPFLSEYLRLEQSAMDKSDIKLATYMRRANWFTARDLAAGWKLFDKALAAVKDSPVLYERVRRERVPLLAGYLDCVRFADDPAISFPMPPEAMAQELIELSQKYGNRDYAEGQPFADYVTKLDQVLHSARAKVPEICKNLPSQNWFSLQGDVDFSVFGLGQSSKYIDDPDASGGKAVWMSAKTAQWIAQAPVPGAPLAVADNWHCYAVLRGEGKVPEEIACLIGLYDTAAKKELYVQRIRLKEIKGKYAVVDLGVHKLTSGMLFFVMPAGCAPELVSDLYLDRLFFVKVGK